MGFIAKILGKEKTVASDVVKTPVPGGWDTMEGFLPGFFGMDWYQRGFSPGAPNVYNPDVAAAISLYKRALMSVPTRHIKRNPDGAGIIVENDSDLTQIFQRPNQYMTWAEMIGVIVDGLLSKGEFACYIEESPSDVNDDGTQAKTLHPIHNFQMVAAVDGSIFYRVSFPESLKHLQNEWSSYMVDEDMNSLYIPQRHIVHGRFEVDPQNPLRALRPLHAYANSIGLGSILRQGQEAFHNNKGQPSGIISTDQSLNAEQASRLRERWNEMSQKMRQGETPILSNGLRWQSTSVSANEGQVIQLLGFTTKDIAKAFGIPPIMLGENSGVTYSNLEQLLYGWRTSGLLSVCMVIEQAFEYSFKLPKHEEMILDISDLARAESMHQAETLTRLVLNGIMRPNEARARLDLAPIDGVASELVSQSQIKPMNQTAELAQRTADREDEKVTALKEREDKRAQQDASGQGNLPNRIDESKKEPPPTKQVDNEALDLMLKGIFK